MDGHGADQLRVNWRDHNAAKAPGQMRAMCYQAVARGATGLLFFQWRASQDGGGKVPLGHAFACRHGLAGLAEVVGFGRELARLGSFEGAAVQARVAVVFSWPNWWALEGTFKTGERPQDATNS